jgi:hypothetical protein
MPANVAAGGRGPGAVRASDAERDATVDRLRAAVGAGRLDLDEFDTRATRAYAARTVGELTALTADLQPAGPSRPDARRGEPLIARFGAIEVTGTTVRTPTGAFPLRGSVWRCFDHWQTRRVIPTWAIALAVIGFFFVPFVSLLFLLVKESRETGVLQVAVWDGVRQHVADLPVHSRAHARAIEHQVGYVRAVARA